MRGGDLDVETVPSGRNVPRQDQDIQDDDEDENFD
jgi:hypothetical protein